MIPAAELELAAPPPVLEAAGALDDGLELPHAARQTTAAAAPVAAHHRLRISLSPFRCQWQN
jgi:hypothetical protein